MVENTAQDWGVEQDLMVETITQESLSQWLEKVLKCNCRMDEWMMVEVICVDFFTFSLQIECMELWIRVE